MSLVGGTDVRRHPVLRRIMAFVIFVAAAVVPIAVLSTSASAAPCDAPVVNPVACENSKTGDANWDATGGGDPSIEGFATTMSANIGDTVKFKIKTSSPYKIDIYRLGYYNGTAPASGRRPSR